MTDKEVCKRDQMENLDTTNYVGDISCSSKDSDTENVDAIKKYIEEQQQEILLKHSTSATDLDSTINKQTFIAEAEDKVDSKFLQQQITPAHESNLSDCMDIFGKRKEKMVLSPSFLKSPLNDSDESKPSEENKKIPSQMRLVNNYISQLENEENMIHTANTTLPQHQNHTGQNLSETKFHLNVHEQVCESAVNIVPEFKKEDLIEDSQGIKEIENSICGNQYTEVKAVKENENKNSKHPFTKQQVKNNLDSFESKDTSNLLKCSYDSEVETLETCFLQGSNEAPRLLHQLLTATNTLENEIKKSEEQRRENANKNTVHSNKETLSIASSVMDMILSDAEAAIIKRKDCNVLSKQLLSSEKVNNSSVSLAIGSQVEAKDFSGMWYPAQIIEVDCEEMEVLVEYDNQPKKHNEWISISSPRLRPIASCVSKAVLPNTPALVNLEECISEQKVEDKEKVTFEVGERCLARWRDNRRFIATIQNNLENGSYEVMFDDGFLWKCPLSRLYKLKESSKHEFPKFAGGTAAPAPAAPAAPTAPADPAAPAVPVARAPAYHTHLFDPTRDYLGSKSERREMKRKLNIKEIFNIGQKRKKTGKEPKASISKIQAEEVKSEILLETTPLAFNLSLGTNGTIESKHPRTKKPTVKKRPFMRKKIKLKMKSSNNLPSRSEANNGIPDAVAAIIGTACKSEPAIDEDTPDTPETPAVETKDSNANDIKHDEVTSEELLIPTESIQTLDEQNINELTEEIKVEPDAEANDKQEEVIGKIKEAITKLEDGITEEKESCVKPALAETTVADEVGPPPTSSTVKEKRKKSSKVKKSKKLKLLQEKKVKKEVAKVKCQLEEMKRQVEAMRQEILLKAEELASAGGGLLPGEWCCRWRDGQPEGAVSELPCGAPADAAPPLKPPLPRRSVQVEDYRLPPGWTKHMVRRSVGHSAGKWDVVLVSPDNRRFHTKSDMRVYLENNPAEAGRLRPFEAALLDFGVHLKLARRLGWVSAGGGGGAGGGEGEGPAPPPAAPAAGSPLLPRRDRPRKPRKHRRELKVNITRMPTSDILCPDKALVATESDTRPSPIVEDEATLDGASIKDGFVHVGSLKVQVIETLLRCPAEGCFKNFRNTTLLKMHIKHYHRDLRKMMGVTPKVLDLAYARTRPTEAEMKRLKCEAQNRIIKVKLPRLQRRVEEQRAAEPAAPAPAPVPAPAPSSAPAPAPAPAPVSAAPPASPPPPEPAAQPPDSPKLRDALAPKPAKRPRVLLPVRAREPDGEPAAGAPAWAVRPEEPLLDFEAAISSHAVRRPRADGWGSEPDSRSSRSADADADDDLLLALSSDSTDDRHHAYLFTENGERIKLVHMKREEIINCHCGFREEDGLMVQCELCLCWQHALCHNIQREADVPEKYTCSICLNPRRGRRRQRFTHDQDRLYEGLLPAGAAARACEPLRRAHELAGNLLRAADALHAARVNAHVAAKKNHPKLYLWAKDWETVELTFAQEKLNSEYSDLSIIINNLGKENLPIKVEDIKVETKAEPVDDRVEKVIKEENQSESPSSLPGILSSPGAVSLDLPISDSEIEKLAKSVQGAGARAAPQPEAAIEDGACRARLLRHLQRCHALLDQRLDSIEAQVAELESQDPSLAEDESAEFCPRAKRTVGMLLRDLDTLEELGALT